MKWACLGLALLAGCSVFRASAGIGFGLGASARVGPLDVGALGGWATEWGNCYGVLGEQECWEFGLPAIVRAEGVRGDTEGVERGRAEGPLAALLRYTSESEDETAFLCVRPGEVAVSVYAGFLAFHFGVDFVAIVRAVFGIEEEDPFEFRSEEKIEPQGLSDTPYTVSEASTPPEKLDALLDDGSRVVRARSGPRSGFLGPWECGVSPTTALVATASRQARDAVARRHDVRGAADLEAAERRHDAAALELAIERAPFAAGACHAARMLGELRLERGALDQAEDAFELEAALAATPEERAEARARVLVTRRASQALPVEPVHETPMSEVRLGELRVGAAGDAAWAIAPTGDTAWLRSDALSEGETFTRAVGATEDLAFVEVLAGYGVALVALDDHGSVRWRAQVPAPSRDEPRAFLVGRGKVFAVTRSKAVALDAASGRVAWAFCRDERKRPSHLPMSWPAIPSRHFDGPRVSLGSDALEWRTDAFPWAQGEPDRLERLDPRTGLPLEGSP